jgi:hypothetical protein
MTPEPAIDVEAFKKFEREGYSRLAQGYDKATAMVTSQVDDAILDAAEPNQASHFWTSPTVMTGAIIGLWQTGVEGRGIVQAQVFWKAVVEDRADFLDRLIARLEAHGIRYCLVGGQAVNAYVEPVVSLDLDVAVATEQLELVERLLQQEFVVERFPHSLNVSAPGSALRVQIRTDPRYGPFVARATPRLVLGIQLPVARLEDLLDGKVWAAMDPGRRPSKRQKDLADIARLLEAYPALRERVPAEILARLV